jgi:integrase
MPKIEKKEKEIFTDAMIEFLFKFDKDDTIKIILMMIFTGLRINELVALKSSDYNRGGNYIIGGSKSEAGTDRAVPINNKVIPYFQYFLSKNKEYIISNTKGGKKDIKNFRDREFYPCLEKYKMLGITPHATRHTFVSLSVKNGMPPEMLKAIVGHADYATSINCYNHAQLEDLQKAINLI